ncbi:MAG: hypothetical protein MHM6MM_008341 [Cercozoa sp. M6MM]
MAEVSECEHVLVDTVKCLESKQSVEECAGSAEQFKKCLTLPARLFRHPYAMWAVVSDSIDQDQQQDSKQDAFEVVAQKVLSWPTFSDDKANDANKDKSDEDDAVRFCFLFRFLFVCLFCAVEILVTHVRASQSFILAGFFQRLAPRFFVDADDFGRDKGVLANTLGAAIPEMFAEDEDDEED